MAFCSGKGPLHGPTPYAVAAPGEQRAYWVATLYSVGRAVTPPLRAGYRGHMAQREAAVEVSGKLFSAWLVDRKIRPGTMASILTD